MKLGPAERSELEYDEMDHDGIEAQEHHTSAIDRYTTGREKLDSVQIILEIVAEEVKSFGQNIEGIFWEHKGTFIGGGQTSEQI